MHRITLPAPHAGQISAMASSKRFTVVRCGRRFGKTTLCQEEAIKCALDGWPVGWFAPDYKTLGEAFNQIHNALVDVVRSKSKPQRIELLTGGKVDFWTLVNKNAGRSRRYKLVVVDEGASVSGLMDAWQGAILPTLADYQGRALFASTPMGRNDFYELAMLSEKDPVNWAHFHAPTSANPYIRPSEIELLRQTMSARQFSQEILAEFVDNEGGVFRNVQRCATATRQNGGIAGHSYIIGVDTAYTSDYTAVVVIDATSAEQVFIDRFNMLDTTIQSGRIEAIYRKFPNSKVVVETNGAIAVIEQLVGRGVPVTGFATTAQTKPQIIQWLESSLDRETIRILNDPIVVGELQGYYAKRSPSGAITYEGKPHDDTVMALAIAWYHAKVPPATIITQTTRWKG